MRAVIDGTVQPAGEKEFVKTAHSCANDAILGVILPKWSPRQQSTVTKRILCPNTDISLTQALGKTAVGKWLRIVWHSTLKKLRRYWSLARSDRRMLLELAGGMILVRAGVRVLGVGRTQSLLRRWAAAGSGPSDSESPENVIRTARQATRIVRRNVGLEGTCLVRSLTLWAVLIRRGVGVDLRVGFRRNDNQLEGHAWVEYQGVPLNEARSVVARYSAFTGSASFDLAGPGGRWR